MSFPTLLLSSSFYCAPSRRTEAPLCLCGGDFAFLNRNKGEEEKAGKSKDYSRCCARDVVQIVRYSDCGCSFWRSTNDGGDDDAARTDLPAK